MSTPKGWSSQEKDQRLTSEFVTVEPIRELQHGMSVVAHIYTYIVATDAVEANSTTSVINATAHVAKKGDVIHFTSGALLDREVRVASVATDAITLSETLNVAPVATDTFEILRHKHPVVDSSGNLFTSPISTGPLEFVLDGATVQVTEDTVTPANNAPLPVKLTSTTGDINITAGDLNVQLSHAGVNYDSTRVGDGTNLLGVTASNEAKVSVTSDVASVADGGVLPSEVRVIAGYDGSNVRVLSTDASGVLNVNGTFSEAAVAADGGALPALTKVVSGYDGANVQVLKTDSSGELQVDVLSAPALSQSTSSVAIGDGTDILAISAAGEASVVVTQPLPAGTNNIGDVDVLSLPAITQGSNSIAVGDGTDIIAVSASGEVSVVVTQSLPAGTNNIGDVDVLTLPSLPAGTNNIGDVDVVSLPSLPAGTNNIGDVDVLTLPAILQATNSIAIGDGTDLIAISAAGEASVVVTQALPAGTNTIGKVDVNQLDVVDFFDTPLLDTSSTNITASAGNPVQVVASLAATVKAIKINDTTGKYIGVYSGAALSEVLECIIGAGDDSIIPVALASGARISLRNMENSAINVGLLTVQFLG